LVQINRLERPLRNTGQIGDGKFYLEPRLVGTVAGMPSYQAQFMEDGTVAATKITRPLFVPITQERASERRIREADKDLADIEAKRNKPRERTTRTG
jgi:hypothetical protein